MKLFFVALMMTGLFGFAGNAAAQKQGTAVSVTGYILDKACVTPKGMSTQAEIDKAQQCTKESTQGQHNYVLYDPQTKKSSDIADQKKAAEFAGDKVRLIGTVNVVTHAIDISEIRQVS